MNIILLILCTDLITIYDIKIGYNMVFYELILLSVPEV